MEGFLTQEQVMVLKVAHRGLREKKLADRIKAVLSLNDGLEYSQISRILLLDETTLRRYVTKFQEKGIDGLLEYRYAGGLSKLTSLQESGLREYCREHTQRTANQVADHIKKHFGFLINRVGTV